MQPADRKPIAKGSPTTKPCTNSEMSGTADEQSAVKKTKTTDGAGKSIRAGPVPLYLIPQTISTEIHAHGGDISEIAVKRTGQHVYAITLTKTPKPGRSQGREQGKNPGGADAD